MVLKTLFAALVLCFLQISAAPAGFFGAVCKTRDTGTVYHAQSEGCDKAAQEEACDTDSKVADPTECKTFKTEAERDAFLAQKPKRAGVTCKIKATGALYRAAAADCGKNAKDFECDPVSTQQLSCTQFKDDETLNEFLNAPLIGAQVKCRLTTGQELELPATDCSKQAQEEACQKKAGFKGQPISCQKLGG